jgi:hypothetical protein
MTEPLSYVIVTNTINRSVDLVSRNLLASLSQRPAPKKVVLIDQNEQPLNFEGGIANNPLLHHITVRVPSVSAARNSMPNIDVDWIVFCDDDGYMDLSYAQLLSELLIVEPSLDVVAGSIIRDDTFDYYSRWQKLGGNLNLFRNSKLLMGSNFVVRKSIFEELNGFDTAYGAGAYWGSSEETDFCWNAQFSNKELYYEPSLKVYHVKPYAGTFLHSLKKAYFYGVGRGALVHKWCVRKRKLIVLTELMQMLLIPVGQCLKSLITLKWHYCLIHLATLLGRINGFVKAFFVSV